MGDIWADLRSHWAAKSGRAILDLFADAGRAEGYSCRADGFVAC